MSEQVEKPESVRHPDEIEDLGQIENLIFESSDEEFRWLHTADPADVLESRELSDEERLNLEKQRVEIDDLRQIIEARKKIFWPLFSVVCLWLLVVAFLLIKQAIGKGELSDTVLATLLGTTTLDIVALLIIPTRFFYASKPN